MSASEKSIAASATGDRDTPAPFRPRRAGRMRRVAFGLLAASLGLVLTLGALEIVARVLARPGKAPPLSTALKGPKQWLPRYTTMGVDVGKVDGEFRIVVIGDSMSWGWKMHAEDAWPSRLEWRLRPLIRPPTTLRVVNASRPNWNTVQQADHFFSRIDELRPDAVLLGFCLNDPEPKDPASRARMDGLRRRKTPAPPLSAWLHRWSTLYRTIWERLENARIERGTIQILRDTFREDSTAWKACLAALVRLQQGLTERHIPFLIVVIPFMEDPFDERYPNLAYHQQIERACAEQGLDCLDLLPLFQGYDVWPLATEPHGDPHPNEVAQRMIADALLDPLVERGMVPVDLDENGSAVVNGCRIDVTVSAPARKREPRVRAPEQPPGTAASEPDAATGTAPAAASERQPGSDATPADGTAPAEDAAPPPGPPR